MDNLSKKISEDPKAKESVEKLIEKIHEKTGCKCKFAITEDEVIDEVYKMMKAVAIKFGCTEDIWEEYVKQCEDKKNRVILVILGNLYANFKEEFEHTMSSESEFFTERQKLLFAIYMELDLMENLDK